MGVHDWKLLFPKDYLAACDLQGQDVTVEIERVVEKEEIKGEGGKKDTVPILMLKGKKKKWVGNITNFNSIERLTGIKKPADWVGWRITLYPTTCNAFGVPDKDCIRVRSRLPKQNESKPPAAPPQPPKTEPEEPYDGPPADYESGSGVEPERQVTF